MVETVRFDVKIRAVIGNMVEEAEVVLSQSSFSANNLNLQGNSGLYRCGKSHTGDNKAYYGIAGRTLRMLEFHH